MAGWIASQSEELQLALIEGLSAPALAALPFLFEVWGRVAHQIEPEGDWVTWVVMGGRGSGKTRTGAEWIRAQVEGATPLAPGLVRRVALLAETWEQAREVMVFGDSGLVACSPRDRVPDYVATRRKLIWPNGAEATLFSAADPESLRGPQFDCAWSDELAKWRRADAAWDMLQFGLRLGERPRQIVTTTPRDIILLRTILADPATVTTRSPTADNRANLAPDFLEKITRRYNGTFTGRQELDGELLDTEGGLFRRSLIEAARVERAPKMDLIVVGVDPPASDGPGADECGIVVVGRSADVFYVLADYSLAGASPARWAAAAVQALRAHQALRIVAEVNQGGNMVATVLQAVDRAVMVRSERARDGKRVRAEPVAALYEQGRVRHVGHFPVLEDQLVAFGREKRSPDRVDALVWAVADLVHEPSGGPRVSFISPHGDKTMPFGLFGKTPKPETKASAVGAITAVHSLGRPAWTPRDTVSLTRVGYAGNIVGFRCVRMIAEACAAVPLRFTEGGLALSEHPLIALMAEPNPGQDGAALIEALHGHLQLSGNAYVEAVAGPEGSAPVELHVLRSDRMRVVPGRDGWPMAYDYRVGNRTHRFQMTGEAPPILHLRAFHPLDDHYGMSPLEAASVPIDVHNAASLWSKALLDNAARPSGAVVYRGPDGSGTMTEEQYRRVVEELEQNHQGARNAGRPMLLEGGLDWKPMGFSPAEMEFLETKNAAAREIALAFGVPPMLLGLPGDNTYANYQEASRAFYRQTVTPLVRRTAAALTGWLGWRWGGSVRVEPDLDRVTALADERDAHWARVAGASFLNDDEKRALLGLPARR